MPDVFTETTNRGCLSRIFGSLAGLLIGPILVVVAVGLLWWNEGRAVEAVVGLNAAAAEVVEAQDSAVSPANDGKLIHVIGAASAGAPIQDSDDGFGFAGEVAVAREAQMYQWQQKEQSSSHDNVGGSQTTTTTYTYEKGWSDNAIDSAEFKHPEDHGNPGMPFRSTRFIASDAKLGAYTLDADTLAGVDFSQAPTLSAPEGWTRGGDYFYKGDAGAPKIGDMRVRYTGLRAGATLSVLAAQSHGGFAPFVAANGYRVHLAAAGNQPAALMIANERKAEATLTWILRAAGTFLMFLGFMLFLGPLSTFASVIPLLGGIVRGATAAFSIVIALPLSLVVIAFAWLAYRPLIGGGLLVMAAGAGYGLWRWHKGRTPHVAAKA